MKARFALLLLVLAVVGCDRTPTDPALDEISYALLSGSSESALFTSSPTSLQHLLRRAVSTYEAERGPAASRRLLASWQRYNEEAQVALRSGDRPTAQSRIAAVRSEELRIVLTALGNNTAERVVADVGVSLAYARLSLARAAAAGKDVGRANALAEQAAQSLQRANSALEHRDFTGALDAATQASDLLDGVHRFLTSLTAIRSLDALFSEAVAKSMLQPAPRVRELLSSLERMNEAARLALRAGDRGKAQAALEAVREQQIAIVLQVQGPAVAGTLISSVDAGIKASRDRLANIKDARIVARADRMLAEAGSLNSRAKAARLNGDAATALDLASHAAGLVNTLQHLFPR